MKNDGRLGENQRRKLGERGAALSLGRWVKRLGWSLIGLLACGCTTYSTVADGDYLLSTTQPGFFEIRLDRQGRHDVVDMLARRGASCSTRPEDDRITRCAYAYCVDARPRMLTWTVGRTVTTRTVRPPKLVEMATVCGSPHLSMLQDAYVARNGAAVVSLD